MDIIIIGAGAAGMMAAIAAAEAGADVAVLERNPYPGKKIGITGKGRCNVTNRCTVPEFTAAVVHNPKFLLSAVNRFTPEDTVEFFEESGVPLKTERGRRVFPVSDKAADIKHALEKRMKNAGVRLFLNTFVTGLEQTANGWKVICGSRVFEAAAVIVAAGGVSYPATGSDGSCHAMLEKLGVKITPLKPSLVPIDTAEDFSSLAGLTLKNVTLTVHHGSDEIWSEMGEMLFTHTGVSGPLVLSASSNMQKYPTDTYSLSLNLKPALSYEELDARVLSDFAKYSARDFVNSLSDLLPQKLIEFVISQSGIDPRKKTNSITRAERESFVNVLRAFSITPSSFRPVDEAIVTAGGIEVKELNPKTMEFRRFPGLFAAGEIIDVDAYTGGYNLQSAFSTGRAAGVGAVEYVNNRDNRGKELF